MLVIVYFQIDNAKTEESFGETNEREEESAKETSKKESERGF